MNPLVVFDLPTGRVSLDPAQVVMLRDTAAAKAGRSSAARDLSLLLDRALHQTSPIALRRAELQTLIEIAATAQLEPVASRLAASEALRST